mmetsp:Transcript_33135/g.84460  ORF Transcript_33135/g.84460 Transcript_33135/m.84460 type:complete len:205 (-) Transcript_33135:10-624(-)
MDSECTLGDAATPHRARRGQRRGAPLLSASAPWPAPHRLHLPAGGLLRDAKAGVEPRVRGHRPRRSAQRTVAQATRAGAHATFRTRLPHPHCLAPAGGDTAARGNLRLAVLAGGAPRRAAARARALRGQRGRGGRAAAHTGGGRRPLHGRRAHEEGGLTCAPADVLRFGRASGARYRIHECVMELIQRSVYLLGPICAPARFAN